jgi:hypothetical protein
LSRLGGDDRQDEEDGEKDHGADNINIRREKKRKWFDGGDSIRLGSSYEPELYLEVIA